MQADNKITALYARYSADDIDKSESNSICNQKQLLEQFALDNHFCNCKFYTDDGFSGTNFNRPDFSRLLNDIELNLIGTVIVKDLSRLGRNYLEVGYYTERAFPANNIRFISITDSVDSDKGYDDFLAIRNIINESYARDISKKQRAALQIKGNSGKRLTTRAIYGYKKDKDNNNQWIIDENTSGIVKEIFKLCIDGYGTTMIANYLRDKKVKTPSAYSGQIRKNGSAKNNPYLWKSQSINTILSHQEYCGDTVNFRTSRKDCMSNVIIKNDPSMYKIFENTHEAIISREDFFKVQEIRNKRRRVTYFSNPPIFGQICFCSSCGSKMYIMRSRNLGKNKKVNCYVCSQYRNHQTCTSHYIKEIDLIEAVKNELKRYFGLENNIMSIIKNNIDKRNAKLLREKEKNLILAQQRKDEINKIVKSLYEDKVNKVINDELFQNLYSNYNQELKEVSDIINTNFQATQNIKKDNSDINRFVTMIEKYKNRLDIIDYDLTHDLIEKIVVFEKDRLSKKHNQKINIYFKGIGLLNSED